MDRMRFIVETYNTRYYIKSILLILTSFILLIFVTIATGYAAPVTKIHDNISGDLTDPECSICHLTKQTKPLKSESIKQKKTQEADTMNIYSLFSTGNNYTNNYTAILVIGQTPYQLGPFSLSSSGDSGWSWWDTDNYGMEKQKNLIALMVLDNTTGTVKPLTGLASAQSAWPLSSYRSYSGTYSYKADTDPAPITTQNNYADNMDLWMIKEINLTGMTGAILTFRTWYSIETDWDYGYVAVSTDSGDSWINLPGTLTTNTDPEGNNLGNGITGSSIGWMQETMDLTPYAGNRILLGFRFKSDAYVNKEGWYVDDINITSGTTTIFTDNAETQPIKTLSVNVTYPNLVLINNTDPLTNSTTLQYVQYIEPVDLFEDTSHPGTYIGYFKYDPFAEQYSGNYTVVLDTTINNTPVTTAAQFQTTIFGCQSCHNKKDGGTETSYIHGEGGGMKSCMYTCHSGSRGFYGGSPPFFGPPLNANPMHVHEMLYGHSGGFLRGAWYPQTPYNIPSHVNTTACTQCHTSFLHDNTGTDTAKIANYTLKGTNISFSSGTHKNMTCENCHGTLSYPAIPENQYQLQGTLGNYKPTFSSHESFTDTYIIAVNSTENLRITLTANNTTKYASLYTIGPVDNTTTALQGPCYGNPCEKTQSLTAPLELNITNPYIGTWIAKLIQLQEGRVNYTITSSYPIERKPIIQIPECNSCHNLSATGGAFTEYEIPDWNPGFAHADTNKDGTLDIQCRMCHNSMHNIITRDCRNCHTTAPVNHPVGEPEFTQYTQSQCSTCHGDPHKIAVAQGENCIKCHGTNYTGANPMAKTTLVDISAFNESIHQNINATLPDTVDNNDCWSCHYKKDMSRQNIRKCSDCHSKLQQWHGNANITTDLSHLW